MPEESYAKLSDALEARSDAEVAARLAEQATTRAERLMSAIERISAVLNDGSLSTKARVTHASLVLADLDHPEAPRCGGEGEIERGVRRDEFGNWDTETFPCHGCPDCEGPRRWTLQGGYASHETFAVQGPSLGRDEQVEVVEKRSRA